MFKAKLIDREDYYKLKSKRIFLMLLPLIPMAMLLSSEQVAIWITIPATGIYIAAFILMVRNQKQLNSVVGNRLIEIDFDQISIKSKQGIEEEKIQLNAVDKIILKEEYSMPQESVKEVGEEMLGTIKQNYIIIQKDGKTRKLDFEFESYYMLNQLNKLIEHWKETSSKIEIRKETAGAGQ